MHPALATLGRAGAFPSCPGARDDRTASMCDCGMMLSFIQKLELINSVSNVCVIVCARFDGEELQHLTGRSGLGLLFQEVQENRGSPAGSIQSHPIASCLVMCVMSINII